MILCEKLSGMRLLTVDKMIVRKKEKVSEPKGERPFKYERNSIEKQKGKTGTINGR
jgi:hypothetical protein